ncbi:MAG: aspartate kinase [Candidatus Izemoplasma sp.]|nr:aspartate kinase [Candidatus Izemoplasma sp.]
MKRDIKVCKFGGTSVASSQQFKQIQHIVSLDNTRKIIVVSAPGKIADSQAKVTDLLYLLYEHIKYDTDYRHLLHQITDRFIEIKNNLGLSFDVKQYMSDLSKNLSKTVHRDWLVSRGEYLTAKLMSEFLGYTFLDSYQHIFVNYDKQIDYDKTESTMAKINVDHGIVMPGFYATTPNKDVTLLSRGGSDTTASIIAYALNVKAYENFTDVNGVYVTDPTIVKDAKIIPALNYSEIKELSYRGAKLFHQEAITPVAKRDIPIIIKNTNQPEEAGTIISSNASPKEHIVTAISGKKEFTIFNITKTGDEAKTKILQSIITIFMRHNIEIEHIPSGIDSFSVIVSHDQVDTSKFMIMSQLSELDGIERIDIEESLALIAVVGKNMAKTPGVAGKLFSALGNAKINIKVIAQSSTELSVIVGVDEPDYSDAITTIYHTFFE